MLEQSRFQPCGWGVFWEEKGSQCSTLKSSEGAAMEFAARLQIPGAMVEPVYRDALHHS